MTLDLELKLALSSDKSNIQNENVDCESLTDSRVMNAGDLIEARERPASCRKGQLVVEM